MWIYHTTLNVCLQHLKKSLNRSIVWECLPKMVMHYVVSTSAVLMTYRQDCIKASVLTPQQCFLLQLHYDFRMTDNLLSNYCFINYHNLFILRIIHKRVPCGDEPTIDYRPIILTLTIKSSFQLIVLFFWHLQYRIWGYAGTKIHYLSNTKQQTNNISLSSQIHQYFPQ